MNNIFKFKQFSIKQNSEVFKVGTDGVLVGCLASIEKADTILDIGTGTGLIALICAQRNLSAQITAIDSEIQAYSLAKENCENSPFTSQIQVIHSELQQFKPKYTFDYIICNPPYFKNSVQLHSKYPIARHQLKLDYYTLIKNSKNLISTKGIIGYILPFEEEENIINLAKSLKLYPIKIIRILGINGGKIKRSFLEFSFEETKIIIQEFIIENSPRVWSDKYKELTKDFYLNL